MGQNTLVRDQSLHTVCDTTLSRLVFRGATSGTFLVGTATEYPIFIKKMNWFLFLHMVEASGLGVFTARFKEYNM